MNNFYGHLIEIDSIAVELDKLNLSEEEKMHLATLIDSSLHNTILDAILSELNEEDKRVFLKHIHEGDNTKIWNFLNEKISRVEDRIKKAADELKSELHKDLKEAKKR